ncbi:Histone acetyltransferase, partial [Globisporangium splendens]
MDFVPPRTPMALASAHSGGASNNTTPRASRVAACERLTPEHAMERQRAQSEPTTVAYKEERHANGQLVISISSGESEDGDSSDGGRDESGEESEYEDEEQEESQDDNDRSHTENGIASDVATDAEGDHDASVSISPFFRKRKRNAVIVLDDSSDEDTAAASAKIEANNRQQQNAPTIYAIDSGDDENEESTEQDGGVDGLGAKNDGDDNNHTQDTADPDIVAADVMVDMRVGSSHESHCDDPLETEGGTTTPEHNSVSSDHNDHHTNVKSEVEPLSPVKTELPSESTLSSAAAREASLPPVETQAPSPVATSTHEKRVRVVPKRVIPLMRKTKLSEEDAAFLLFYGISEAPTTYILGLIIEYIDRCVGETSLFVSKYIRFMLWCKLNARVNDGLEAERMARSEWMKIVFSSEDASMRPRISRAQLLPRPVRITVRPVQFVRKRTSVGAAMTDSVKQEQPKRKTSSITSSPGKERVKEELQHRVTEVQQNGRANTPATGNRSYKKRKAEVIIVPDMPMGAMSNKSAPYTPRKHRRRYGSISSPTDYSSYNGLPARSRSKTAVLSNSADLKPLTSNDVVTGINRSLPVGWTSSEDTNYTKGSCISVSPLQNMSAAELEDHINSVRSEGRIKSFEKLGEILAKLMSDARNHRGVFNTPVDPIALNLPTYTEIIKVRHFVFLLVAIPARRPNPMDLGTVKKRLAEGKYLEMQDFVADVRLVFENAKLFNAPNHSIHVDADILLRRFDTEIKNGLDRLQKRNLIFSAREVAEQTFAKDPSTTPREMGPECGATSVGIDCNTPTGSKSHAFGLECQQAAEADDVNANLVRMKCDTTVEPWVKCSECDRWMHQICGLYNPVQGEHEKPHDYVCPLCCWRHKSSIPSPSSSLHNLLKPASSDKEESKSTCLNIAPCELSEFIQSYLRHELEAIGEGEAAKSLNVRVLSFPDEKMTIPEGVVCAFDENSKVLSQMCPERDVSPQRLPSQVSFLSRGIYLFQKHDGVDISLFTMYSQEFGEDCELAANRRAVYIAYIDSIRYLKPASARTSAYHLMMMAYFDYIRRHGFERVHIWSCPPQKRISYVFWCRPAFQKTPSAEHLRSWYNRLLGKAKARNIVRDWTTLYDRYLSHADSDLPLKEEQPGFIATRGVTSRIVDPGELVWPATELPPIFDGDFIPAELDRILGRIGAHNGKIRRASESGGKNASIGSSGGKHAVGGQVVRIKEDPDSHPPVVQQQQQVEYKLREVFSKLQFAVKRLKQDLLVVYLAVDDVVDPITQRPRECRPQTTVPDWCRQVPRFFGNRFMFHQLCSSAGYQFDSLRRAKHSTMMILHHYFNEHVPQVNVFCRECSLLITNVEYWSCPECDRFALCDTCCKRDGARHQHPLQYSTTVRIHHHHRPPPAAAATTYNQNVAIQAAAVAAQAAHRDVAMLPVFDSQEVSTSSATCSVSMKILDMSAACVTLDDIARDGFRRSFFLHAFAGEHDALELSFAFLGHVRKYKALAGNKDSLQHIAKELVAMYVADPSSTSEQLQSSSRVELFTSPEVQPLCMRIRAAVEHDRSPLDLFSGLEEHVKTRLTQEKFPQFLKSEHYTKLCDAIREKRDLPLGEILVNARRTHFLELFLQHRHPELVGNLRFWVEVQTLFLPLIQANLFSVALFEEIQATVRRLFNVYLTETSSATASLISDAMRKETLKKIMMLQGEPFSPPRYASIFRAAQDTIWGWLQTDVYPAFRSSQEYVLLVVEIENLESDHQLRRLSEQMQSRSSSRNPKPSASTAKKSEQPKSSAIIIPVGNKPTQQQLLQRSRQTVLAETKCGTDDAVECKRVLQLEAFEQRFGFRSICFHSLEENTSSNEDVHVSSLRIARRYATRYNLFCSTTGARPETGMDHLAYCWNKQCISTVPAVMSPSHRAQHSLPKPSVHDFVMPTNDGRELYGVCLTRWHAAGSSPLSETTTRPANSNSTTFETHDDAERCLPSFISVTSGKPMFRKASASICLMVENLSEERMLELLSALPVIESPTKTTNLNARYSEFCLREMLGTCDFPLHWAFKELSTQVTSKLWCKLWLVDDNESVGAVARREICDSGVRTTIGAGSRRIRVAGTASSLRVEVSAYVCVLLILFVISTSFSHFVRLPRPMRWHATDFSTTRRNHCPLSSALKAVSPSRVKRVSSSAIVSVEPYFDLIMATMLGRFFMSLLTTFHAHSSAGNSIYNTHKVGLQLQVPVPSNASNCAAVNSGPTSYAKEILQSHAAVLDIDNDDLYLPGKMDVPEFPQTLVRSLEGNVKEVLARHQILNADTRLFRNPPSQTQANFIDSMTAPLCKAHYASVSADDPAQRGSNSVPAQDQTMLLDHGTQLAFLGFLEALFGDVVYHFCSFGSEFPAADEELQGNGETTYLVFEVDSFLDAHIELGCRDFFRQCFQTETASDALTSLLSFDDAVAVSRFPAAPACAVRAAICVNMNSSDESTTLALV